LRRQECGVHVHNAELTSIGCDHPDGADSNLPVDADAFCRILNKAYLS
jgi:hypothetical protein